MPKLADIYTAPPDLTLGRRLNSRVPAADQERQRAEVEEILERLRRQSGVILADEVGMGKTFVALGVAYSIALRSPRGPAIVMVPPGLIDKWEQDLRAFCSLYVERRHPVRRDTAEPKDLIASTGFRYGVARHSIELMRLLDDAPRTRCHLIFLAQGAMARRQTDKWVRLALIGEALRRHARGGASRLIQVRGQIHRFLGELLWAIGQERAHGLGDELWEQLLRTAPDAWRETYNEAVRDDRRLLKDDPVPKSVVRALHRIQLRPLADALQQMPVRAKGGDERVSERISEARQALKDVEGELWKELLAETRWRSPLLVMDEAHHLKNPGTSLARQLQSADLEEDLRTGDGALANAFDRMLFLTATPFQLGHRELVRVLERFADVRWDPNELGDQEKLQRTFEGLSHKLDDTQRTAIALQRAWSHLRPEDVGDDSPLWWDRLSLAPREGRTYRQNAVVDAYDAARRSREAAEEALRPWVLRHNKGATWVGTTVPRRKRLDGAPMIDGSAGQGLPIEEGQLLPFFLAARSAVRPGQDLLGEALSSSFEAFRFTRESRHAAKDEQDDADPMDGLSHSRWYLKEFDRALERCSFGAHPKVAATVRVAVNLWEAGEKVLVFGFYRHTCRALRRHISQEIERRILAAAQGRLRSAGQEASSADVERLLERTQRRFFDDVRSPGRRALDSALRGILEKHSTGLSTEGVSAEQQGVLQDVMRRFLRVATTLARCFPLEALDSGRPAEAVAITLDSVDASGVSWRQKFDGFLSFLLDQCSPEERALYLDAAQRTQTRDIRVEDAEPSGGSGLATAGARTLANVQVATGETKRETRERLKRAFNTPFFPDILVCSEVMAEGVDLQRFCRHVIHHDLDWNPSVIEQRTGRIDRIGCKAEGRQPVAVYLPYLSGTADERQYRVMYDREQWFRVVMGQDEVARLITPDSAVAVPVPEAVSDGLAFRLGLEGEDSPVRALEGPAVAVAFAGTR
jgi:ERCC4-related helicase